MKKLLFFTLIAFVLLFTCKKDNKETPMWQDCTFGMKPWEFNTTMRQLPEEEEATKKEMSLGPPNPQQSAGLVLLDFDGHIVSGTSWNYAGDIVCSPSGLTAAQQQQIIDTVYSKFAPFNMIITTSEKLYKRASANKRMRCIITQSYEWYGMAGGVAFVNSFTWGNDTPCFVFSILLNYNTKPIQEASSHEVGHTLGLYHQSSYDTLCVKTAEYNHGNGMAAPIMGYPYALPATWWIGPNSYGCNSIQNDTLIIKTTLGL